VLLNEENLIASISCICYEMDYYSNPPFYVPPSWNGWHHNWTQRRPLTAEQRALYMHIFKFCWNCPVRFII